MKGKHYTGLLQSPVQFKGGVDEFEDFIKQISNYDPSFDGRAYLKKFGLGEEEEIPLHSDTIHLPPFRKKL